MQDRHYVPFQKEMIKDYTVLVPNMLPMHFKIISGIMKSYGYNFELLEDDGGDIAEIGLRYTHNDTCYPAIIVVGQFMKALLSGKYDLHKTALIMFQTGGGCRASNYISLIRKALKKAGMEYIPVISFNLAGIEKHSGFKLSIKKLHRMFYGVLYGDLLMYLVARTRPFEKNIGDSERLADEWSERLGRELGTTGRIRKKKIRENYGKIVADFNKILAEKKEVVKVGIVGEFFVKYSPAANNSLESFLISEGAQTVVPGLCDFCLYYIYNRIVNWQVYKKGYFSYRICKYAYRFLNRKRGEINFALISGGFEGLTPFDEVVHLTDGLISRAVQMGEGWLLTAEMAELAQEGVGNIVCTQPFGCLPNHICGKGMMKPLKELYPDVNIVAIDYDTGASRVNQENRLKLMLANAKKKTASQNVKEAVTV